ncbi:uncharacterized protein MONBRDRAFT_8652 [Monosiga brevicollis MX1]|uniref:Uncharacterized protein n=1 Tax=Monosiga brevicollis TaxID=81824 RepID=A9V0Q2_MONBE|nr:uncharacterized protein MONBRDRAFT_8652 [Monosiga brevicollis MX1]EDQ88677.1 predicted protein [Monosiga brevicollis MX1]|eukprot:XP_001746290.1 hypothetical protein [Monosiga brevicollis MX1]
MAAAQQSDRAFQLKAQAVTALSKDRYHVALPLLQEAAGRVVGSPSCADRATPRASALMARMCPPAQRRILKTRFYTDKATHCLTLIALARAAVEALQPRPASQATDKNPGQGSSSNKDAVPNDQDSGGQALAPASAPTEALQRLRERVEDLEARLDALQQALYQQVGTSRLTEFKP